VPHGVVSQTLPFRPGRCGAVQRHHPLGPLLVQAHPQQVGEQVVIPPPAVHLIQRRQEQVGPLHQLQQSLTIGAPGHRIAQPSAQAL
jgi:hypothetical protein